MGIKKYIVKIIGKVVKKTLRKVYEDDPVMSAWLNTSNPYISNLLSATPEDNLFYNRNYFKDSIKGEFTNLGTPYRMYNSTIGKYTYISKNSVLNNTTVGKFCSIGPNLICGWGIHPLDGISTAPMFYSTMKQNGMTLSDVDKVEELKSIEIGNDVFIGMNVSILDGVTIGDGAVIGAGCVVSKDIPPYAVAIGNPVKIIKYRFDEKTIKKLLEIKWWDWDLDKLKDVEQMFFNIDEFIEKYYRK